MRAIAAAEFVVLARGLTERVHNLYKHSHVSKLTYKIQQRAGIWFICIPRRGQHS